MGTENLKRLLDKIDGRDPYELIKMPVEQARLAKWQAGQVEHGDVMTEDPLSALYAECLDGINYTNTLIVDGNFSEDVQASLANISMNLQLAANVVRSIWKLHPQRHYEPRAIPFR